MKVGMSPLSGEMKVFLIASLINATGSALMWPLVSMFVFDELGRSMTDAGLVILVQSLGGIAGQLLGGALYHKAGVRRLIVGSLALNAVGLLCLPAASAHWTVFVALMAWIGLFNAMAMPAIQSFIGFRFTERRAEMFNIVYVANNIGVALGTAMSGFLADFSYTFSFIANGVSSALFAVFFFVYLKMSGESHPAGGTAGTQRAADVRPSAWLLLRNIRLYLFLAVGGLLLHLGNSIWNAGVSPFIISEGLSKQYYGLLWTLNGILIFAAQPIVAWIRVRLAKSVQSQMTASSLFYCAGFAVILAVPNYPGMVAGMVLATLGEMLIAPAVPAYLSEYAGKDAPFYIGLTGGVGAAGRVVGPYAMGVLYDSGGLHPVAWLAVLTAAGAAVFYYAHALLHREPSAAVVPAPLARADEAQA
ncbi:MFS transporter [Paenibacillus sp. TRM 82003]|nr:MFS transporter [Paenibacillus sp. TRM 82003]